MRERSVKQFTEFAPENAKVQSLSRKKEASLEKISRTDAGEGLQKRVDPVGGFRCV